MAEINEFQRLDVVSDDSDHYFFHPPWPRKKKIKKDNTSTSSETQCTTAARDCFTNAGSEIYKKIMREWRILDQNLPESIYVRVYEKRIDLLRAVIVGAAGTPYHDGLFFLDIVFPPDYPTHPPIVNYRSYGFELNPNMWKSGQICLSLLNTWVGNNNEKWNSSESTILQLLVSIQGLVLNEKPYFNEAGRELFGSAILEKKAEVYNEKVFALNCRTMLCLLEKPPKNFETFVVGHFRQRARAILGACNDYVNGRVRVGYYGDNGSSSSTSSSSSVVKVSVKFTESMRVLYPQLVTAFQRSGASLGSSIERLTIETNGSSKEGQIAGRKCKAIFKKMIGKIKKFSVSALKAPRKNDMHSIGGEVLTKVHLEN